MSGHRFGTAEIESAINEASIAVESAVVGFDHPIKGQAIHAFVISESALDEAQKQVAIGDVLEAVEKGIGKIAKPARVQFVQGLPKTRSGKIMRRILRKIASGEFDQFGDTSTLLDPSVVDSIKIDAQTTWFTAP